MAIRWSQIQYLTPTEEEINLLAGLTADASFLNILDGYTGTTQDLNDMVGAGQTLNNHLALDATSAHTFTPGSVDGEALADATVSQNKLSFNAATTSQVSNVEGVVSDLRTDHDNLQSQVNTLADLVIPDQGDDIAEALNLAVQHISNPLDAHDASAISYGTEESGYYFLTADFEIGQSTISVPENAVRTARVGDEIRLFSNSVSSWISVVQSVDYDAQTITLQDNANSDFLVSEQARMWNQNENNVQEGIDRSLKNNTDTFSGRLTFVDPYSNTSLRFAQDANFLAAGSYNYILGADSDHFQIYDDNELLVFGTDGEGNSLGNTHSLRDFVNNYDGLITKEELSEDHEWKFPNRSGWIGIGDLTFQDLLRVTADTGTGELSVAPGVLPNVIGETTRAWVNMAQGSDFQGETLSVEGRLSSDGELSSLSEDYLAFQVYLTYNDDLFFHYGAPSTTPQLAIDSIPPFLPTAYMKLALVSVKGDGLGGIENSSLTIHEDLRPLLTQGMSNAHYDESSHFEAPLLSTQSIQLPNNSRANNKQQAFAVGSGELEVYVNGTFRERGRDYVEVSGGPPGVISFNYDLPANSVVRFRISWGAATAISVTGGGGGGGSLQDAYSAGSQIFTTTGNPVGVSAPSVDEAGLQLNGVLRMLGVIEDTHGLELASRASEPGNLSSTRNKIYSNSSNHLLYKKVGDRTYNLTQELDLAKTQVVDLLQNTTGSTIVAGTPVAQHNTSPGQIVRLDVSSDGPASRVIGVVESDIPHNSTGKVVLSGKLPGGGTGFSHNSELYADPSSPGAKNTLGSISFSSGNRIIKLATVRGSDLYVNLQEIGFA